MEHFLCKVFQMELDDSSGHRLCLAPDERAAFLAATKDVPLDIRPLCTQNTIFTMFMSIYFIVFSFCSPYEEPMAQTVIYEFHHCPICQKRFAGRTNQLYCSEQCRQRANYVKNREQRLKSRRERYRKERLASLRAEGRHPKIKKKRSH